MKTIHVTAAVIIRDNQILCVQRGENKHAYTSKKWEFPGGKVEENEAIEDTIVREISEELNLNIHLDSHLIQVDHTYPDFRLIMDAFVCFIQSGELQLTEHIAFKWLNKDELVAVDWAAADVPIVEKLTSNKSLIL
jgi:8-oxo-dGTP diphosphatase